MCAEIPSGQLSENDVPADDYTDIDAVARDLVVGLASADIESALRLFVDEISDDKALYGIILAVDKTENRLPRLACTYLIDMHKLRRREGPSKTSYKRVTISAYKLGSALRALLVPFDLSYMHSGCEPTLSDLVARATALQKTDSDTPLPSLYPENVRRIYLATHKDLQAKRLYPLISFEEMFGSERVDF